MGATTKFKTILADPPWRFSNWSMAEKAVRGEQWARRNGRSPYDCMGTDDICGLPVRDIAAPDSVLLLWATNPKLEDAFQVVSAWGFQFKSMITWVKMARAAAPRIGLGYHARSATEHLLIAGRGKHGIPDVDRRPCTAMFCPIGEHSAKPEFQYDIAEGYQGPYLEMFHRPRTGNLYPPRDGWTFLGNEVDGQDIGDALRALLADRDFGDDDLRPSELGIPASATSEEIHRALAPRGSVYFTGGDGKAVAGRIRRLVVELETVDGVKLPKPVLAEYGAAESWPAGMEIK